MELTSLEIRRKYAKFAPWYDWMEGIPEFLGVHRFRRELLQRVSGNVLEIAVGTGKNLRYYPSGCRIVAVDLSLEMLGVARKRAAGLKLNIPFSVMDAEALAFPDQSFDTVVSSLTLCTFPDPVAALREMTRADRHAKPLGCHWNRQPQDLAAQAGLKLTAARRTFFGIFHILEVMPT